MSNLYKHLARMAKQQRAWGDFMLTCVPASPAHPNKFVHIHIVIEGRRYHIGCVYPTGMEDVSPLHEWKYKRFLRDHYIEMPTRFERLVKWITS